MCSRRPRSQSVREESSCGLIGGVAVVATGLPGGRSRKRMKASTPIASVTIPSACYTEREHHIEIARALLAKGNERLVLGRAVPSIERVHVGKFDDHNASTACQTSGRDLSDVPEGMDTECSTTASIYIRDVDGWTEERSRCGSRTNFFQARLGPDRLLETRCIQP